MGFLFLGRLDQQEGAAVRVASSLAIRKLQAAADTAATAATAAAGTAATAATAADTAC